VCGVKLRTCSSRYQLRGNCPSGRDSDFDLSVPISVAYTNCRAKFLGWRTLHIHLALCDGNMVPMNRPIQLPTTNETERMLIGPGRQKD
jgi:hypothetical protein